MSRVASWSAALCIASVLCCPSQTRADPAAEVNARAQTCVVKLYGAGGLGGVAPYQTGVVVSADGLIATVDSLVLELGEATALFSDGNRKSATLVGSDPITGVALLRTQPPLVAAPHINFHSGGPARIGQSAYVFANVFGIAAGDEPVSMIAGVVCGYVTPPVGVAGSERPFLLDSVTGVPGLPGGLVLTRGGAPLGLLTRVATSEVTGLQVNPVLPPATVAARVEALMAGNEVTRASPTPDQELVSTLKVFGFAMIPDLAPRTPPYVDYVRSGSQARAVGLLEGDLIVAVGDSVVSSQQDLLTSLGSDVRQGNAAVQLTVKRDSELVKLAVPLEVESP